MKIVIKKLQSRGYKGTLFLYDDSIEYTSGIHKRPGCAAREVLNWLQIQYGAPLQLTLDLEWE